MFGAIAIVIIIIIIIILIMIIMIRENRSTSRGHLENYYLGLK